MDKPSPDDETETERGLRVRSVAGECHSAVVWRVVLPGKAELGEVHRFLDPRSDAGLHGLGLSLFLLELAVLRCGGGTAAWCSRVLEPPAFAAKRFPALRTLACLERAGRARAHRLSAPGSLLVQGRSLVRSVSLASRLPLFPLCVTPSNLLRTELGSGLEERVAVFVFAVRSDLELGWCARVVVETVLLLGVLPRDEESRPPANGPARCEGLLFIETLPQPDPTGDDAPHFQV